MRQKTQKKSLRQRGKLTAIACMVLGSLLLGACSSGSGPTSHSTGNSSSSISATPTVSPTLQSEGNAQLQAYQQWITLMQQSGGTVANYQQQYTSDQQALTHATTDATYTTALNTLQGQVQAIKIPAMKQESVSLQQKLQQQVSSWGAQHTYHDNYNGQTYELDYEYDNAHGIGGPQWLQQALSSNQTLADYQQTVEDLNMWLYNFQQMQADSSDKTPANQAHQSDTTLLQHYGDMNERVVVVSLIEQVARVYDSGKLVYSFPVTTGQPDLPSPPGNWWFEGKQHPTVFKSSEPKGSPDWYPDTPITYAMQYHSNGYFFHDAWWRTQFGPGTNFPHQDPNGDPFAGQGSHGCVNMSTNDAGWLYGFISVYTRIVIY